MRFLNEQWDDSLRSVRYPFAGTGPIQTAQGPVVPDDLFLDLNLMCAQETQVVTLASIQVTSTTAQYRFEFQDGSLAGLFTSTTIDTQLMPILLGTLVAGYCKIDLGAAQVVRGWVPGLYTLKQTEVLPHLLVISDPKWRRGFLLPDGAILTGSVYLVADRGLWFERTTDGFRLHASGDPFDGRTIPARGLLALNGIGPDLNGNVNLIGLSPTNISGSTFIPVGTPFRINLTPAPNQLTIELTGAG